MQRAASCVCVCVCGRVAPVEHPNCRHADWARPALTDCPLCACVCVHHMLQEHESQRAHRHSSQAHQEPRVSAAAMQAWGGCRNPLHGSLPALPSICPAPLSAPAACHLHVQAAAGAVHHPRCPAACGQVWPQGGGSPIPGPRRHRHLWPRRPVRRPRHHPGLPGPRPAAHSSAVGPGAGAALLLLGWRCGEPPQLLPSCCCPCHRCLCCCPGAPPWGQQQQHRINSGLPACPPFAYRRPAAPSAPSFPSGRRPSLALAPPCTSWRWRIREWVSSCKPALLPAVAGCLVAVGSRGKAAAICSPWPPHLPGLPTFLAACR